MQDRCIMTSRLGILEEFPRMEEAETRNSRQMHADICLRTFRNQSRLFGIHAGFARSCRQNLTHEQLNADFERCASRRSDSVRLPMEKLANALRSDETGRWWRITQAREMQSKVSWLMTIVENSIIERDMKNADEYISGMKPFRKLGKLTGTGNTDEVYARDFLFLNPLCSADI